jgi:hypothetical protein
VLDSLGLLIEGRCLNALVRQANVNELLSKPLVSRDIAKALARLFGTQAPPTDR